LLATATDRPPDLLCLRCAEHAAELLRLERLEHGVLRRDAKPVSLVEEVDALGGPHRWLEGEIVEHGSNDVDGPPTRSILLLEGARFIAQNGLALVADGSRLP